MKIFIVIGLILIVSCTSSNPTIKVVNKTSVCFDSVYVYTNTDQPFKLYNLESMKTIKRSLHFEDTSSADGAYRIQLFKSAEIVRDNLFGYYTNGASINRAFVLTIQPDTIIVNSR